MKVLSAFFTHLAIQVDGYYSSAPRFKIKGVMTENRALWLLLHRSLGGCHCGQSSLSGYLPLILHNMGLLFPFASLLMVGCAVIIIVRSLLLRGWSSLVS